jgi:hypothetical protein
MPVTAKFEKRFAELDAKFEKRFAEQSRSLYVALAAQIALVAGLALR